MHSAGTNEVKYLNLDIPRKIVIALLFALLFLIPVLSYAATPINNPEFWIKKLKNPDESVLSAEEIQVLNSIILDNIDHMTDIESMPDYVTGDRVFEWLWTGFLLNPGVRYDASGRKLSEEFLDDVAYNMGLDSIAEEAQIKFGVVVARGDIRALPTDTAMLATRSRGGFDTIQYTSAHPSEPVALLHTSRDGEWGFFQTSTLRGWMRMDRVAFGDREDIISRDEDFLVVTGSRVKVYRDAKLKEPLEQVKMGALLRYDGSRKGKEPWRVLFPEKGPAGELVWTEAYLSPKADVHEGYLAYTRRNIINQAFKMLGEEYGWGGKEGRRDCGLIFPGTPGSRAQPATSRPARFRRAHTRR
ncbi:MAG: SH3 domain-containing protein [Deltaproteobacteria bacterium]|nr:SH3 domain-containing protein [Deltaproteobacteria bacterium]